VATNPPNTPPVTIGASAPPISSSAPPSTASAPPVGANATTVSVQSVPSGLGVTIATGSSSTTATTPTSTTPRVSNFATVISIAPSNGGPAYTYAVDQHDAGGKTFLYNQVADTNGSIGSIFTSSAARSFGASSSSPTMADASMPRRFARGSLGRPAESATRLVVRYRAAALRAGRGMRALEATEGIERGSDIGPQTGAILTRVVDVPAGRSIARLAANLRANAEVASAAPERLYYMQSTQPVIPNDTHFSNTQQWALFATGAVNAWGYTTGSSGVSIAIIDTGVDFTHADLNGKIAYAERVVNGVTNAGTNTSTGANYAQDTDGHGTNVAGIAAANTNNGFGFAGMGYNTSLQVYKVFADGVATSSPPYSPSANSGDVTQAIYDAVAHGAKVINLSLGTCQVAGADAMQRDAVAYAIAHNVTVVAAAGNERAGSSDATCSGGSSTVDFPAAYDGVIAVGASKYDDTTVPMTFSSLNKEGVASYSNSGPGLALVAPGGDPTSADTAANSTVDYLHWIAGIYSTTAVDPNAQCRNKADCRALFAGTSQASPHVAGAAALMLALNGGLSPAQIKSILTNTADDIGDPNQGAGRLDVYRALAALTGDATQPALPTNANFVAFAYAPNGSNVPQIVDVTYASGVRVASNGSFRIADIPATAPNYKIGVWYDANGDGRIDAGDYFGSSQLCTAAGPCGSAAGIVVHPVPAGFVLN